MGSFGEESSEGVVEDLGVEEGVEALGVEEGVEAFGVDEGVEALGVDDGVEEGVDEGMAGHEGEKEGV